MEAVILKCRPGAQFHFGEIAQDVNTSLSDTSNIIHSDTLFSALIFTLNLTQPEKINEIVECFRSGQIKISSGYYCLENDGDFSFFLPKPVHYNLLKVENPKALKKVEFISKNVWEAGILANEWEDHCFIIQKKFVLSKGELSEELNSKLEKLKFYNKHTLPKVAVHKPSQEDSLYNQTNIQIANNKSLAYSKNAITDSEQVELIRPLIHFYFLLDFQETVPDSTRKLIKNLIQILEDTGIGGERNVGCGQIEKVEFKPFSMNIASPSTLECSLSMISPKASDLDLILWHNVKTRGGRGTAKDGTLKRVRLMSEGALMKPNVTGDIVSIHENQPYLRYGKPFNLPVSQNSIFNDVIN